MSLMNELLNFWTTEQMWRQRTLNNIFNFTLTLTLFVVWLNLKNIIVLKIFLISFYLYVFSVYFKFSLIFSIFISFFYITI